MIRKAALKAAFALVLGTASALPPAPAEAVETFCRTAVGHVFSIDVPPGWTSAAVPGGCTAGRADGTEFVTVAYYAPRGKTTAVFAEELARELKAKPRNFRTGPAYAAFECTVNGRDISVAIAGEARDFDDEIQVVARKGTSRELEHIIASAKF